MHDVFSQSLLEDSRLELLPNFQERSWKMLTKETWHLFRPTVEEVGRVGGCEGLVSPTLSKETFGERLTDPGPRSFQSS